MSTKVTPTKTERFFDEDQIIVSKTDLKGHLTYVNPVFLKLYGGTEKELLGKPHSIVRHPDMPRCIFKLLWDNISNGKEIFAYVKNMSKNGDYYWVLAHATPSRDNDGNITGYHSNRRVPDRQVINEIITPLYEKLIMIEQKNPNSKHGMNDAVEALNLILKEKDMAYDEFIFSLQK